MTETLFSMILVTELCWGREREQVFIDKQKDDLDGAAVSTGLHPIENNITTEAVTPKPSQTFSLSSAALDEGNWIDN